MNKILAILLAATLSASATTIQWSANSATSRLYGLSDGASLTYGSGSQTANLVVYFFKLGDYEEIIGKGKVEASELSSYAVATAKGQTTNSDKAAGRIQKSTTTTAFTDAGVSFFARAYTTFDGTSYFIDLFAGSGTDGAWTTTASGDESIPENFAYKDATYGGSTSTTVGTKNAWVAVPEPSTAMLALAGLALLIKRRRA